MPLGVVVGDPKKIGWVGSVEAVCEGELEVEVPPGVVVGEPKTAIELGATDEEGDVEVPEVGKALVTVVAEPPEVLPVVPAPLVTW